MITPAQAKPAEAKPVAATIAEPAKPVAEPAKPVAEPAKPIVVTAAPVEPAVAVDPPVAKKLPAPVAASPVKRPVSAPLPSHAASVAPVAALSKAKPKPSFLPNFTSFKETFTMDMPNFDFASAFKTAFSDAQEKAKAAYEKSTEAMGDAGEFAKGNVEALVESSKILASGMQELTSELVAESPFGVRSPHRRGQDHRCGEVARRLLQACRAK